MFRRKYGRKPGIDRPGDGDPTFGLPRFMPDKYLLAPSSVPNFPKIARLPDRSVVVIGRSDQWRNHDDPGAFGLIPG